MRQLSSLFFTQVNLCAHALLSSVVSPCFVKCLARGSQDHDPSEQIVDVEARESVITYEVIATVTNPRPEKCVETLAVL